MLFIIVYGTFKARSSLQLHGIFLKYATKVIQKNKAIVSLIPIFIALLIGLAILIMLELKGFWSAAHIDFDINQLFYDFRDGDTTFFTVLIGVQAIWGLCFIK